MRAIHQPRTRRERRFRRHLRLRQKVRGSAERPRLVVFRSLRHIYAQIIDDDAGRTVVGVGDQSKDLAVEGGGKMAAARAVGKRLAERAVAAGVKRVVFDRGGYPYHGRVKAVAEAAREGGLEF